VAPSPVDELPFEVSDFDLDAGDLDAPSTHHEPSTVSNPPIDFDFGELSLDLDKPSAPAASPAPAELESEIPELDMPSAGDSEPMARKIELADEFRRIGDHEGARELLEEVVSKANGALKSRAQTMLDALG
jgi:pilus assembly protein FimV